MNLSLARANKQSSGGFSHRYFRISQVGLALSLASLTLFVGCHKNQDSSLTAQRTAAIEVNGVCLSPADIDREIDFRQELVRFRKPKQNLEKTRLRITSVVTNEIVTGLLFQTLADACGIQATATVTNDVLGRYRKTFARGRKTLKDLEVHLSETGLADVYTNNLVREIAREAYLSDKYGAELKVSEKDVDALLARIRRFNEVAAATNALAYAKATNLWLQISAGADFAALADKESEDLDRLPGGEIGECEKTDFENSPGYWDAVSALMTGEVSAILTTDVGLEIVKALTPLKQSDNTGSPSRKLARIYIRRPLFHPEWSRETARSELEQNARQAVLAKAFDAARSNATVFINGNRLNLPSKKEKTENKRSNKQ